MESKSTIQLTRKMVRKLTRRIFPYVKMERSRWLMPDTDIYCGKTGSQGLILVCENDWQSGCGRIKFSILDATAGSSITQYFRPDTLERDFDFEAKQLGKEA